DDCVARRSWSVVLGLTPVIAWEVFSFVYYGSFVPNTAYAKLSNGIALSALLHQGFVYLVDSASHDPLTLLTIGASLVMTWRLGTRRDWALAAGAVLYLLYVIWVGGDFMSGRMLTP